MEEEILEGFHTMIQFLPASVKRLVEYEISTWVNLYPLDAPSSTLAITNSFMTCINLSSMSIPANHHTLRIRLTHLGAISRY